jgi:hypothetical protein
MGQQEQQYPRVASMSAMNGSYNIHPSQPPLSSTIPNRRTSQIQSSSPFTSAAPSSTSSGGTRRSVSLQLLNSASSRREGQQATYGSSTSYQHNIGVVTPLIYPPPASIRSVSSSSNTINSVQPTNNHFYSPVTPIPRIDEISSTTTSTSNYDWSSSSTPTAQLHRNTQLLPSLARTTSTKHERHASTATNISYDSNYNNTTTIDNTSQQQQQQDHLQQEQYSSATKRIRPNSYIAPRHIPDTYTSRVGSIAIGNMNRMNGSNPLHMSNSNTQSNTITTTSNNNDTTTSSNNNNNRVQLRRQLSSGKIESFLSGNNDNDGMDVDTIDVSQQQRPRSMSF